MTSKHKCAGKIWSDNPRDGSGRVYSCTRNATIEHDGQWYCWQHDPERVEADKKKRRADSDAKMDRRSAMYDRRARDARLAALVNEETAALLEQLAWHIDSRKATESSQATYTARALAARIREALGETE